MNNPQLTRKVEKKILSIIEEQEANASVQEKSISSKYYMQLADLYHFQKDFSNEASILKRFARLDSAANDDLIEIYDRIDRANRLSEFKILEPVKSPELMLVPEFDDNDNISISSTDVISKRVNKSKTPFIKKSHRVLSVCAAYTGRTDEDEVILLSLILSEVNPSRKKCKTLSSFEGIRKTRKTVPNKTSLQFSLNQVDYSISPFDHRKIKRLFDQADFVVSHNDADVERKLISVLIPEVAEKPWYSSQKDIPWGALGYETRSLTQLCKAHGERLPRTSIERANGIIRLLNSLEPCGQQTYLERLYNMQPMKALEWTPTLKKQQKRLKRNKWYAPLLSTFILFGVSGLGIYLYHTL